MKHLSVLFFLFMSLSMLGQTRDTITIDPYLSFQNYEHFRRLTLSSPDSYVEFIQGFEHEWGYTYKLVIDSAPIGATLSDGSTHDYSLIKVLSKERVPEDFEFVLTLNAKRYYYELDSSEQHMNQTIEVLNDSTFLYFEEVEIEVPADFREVFQAIREGKTTKRGTFQFVDEKRIRLVKVS